MRRVGKALDRRRSCDGYVSSAIGCPRGTWPCPPGAPGRTRGGRYTGTNQSFELEIDLPAAVFRTDQVSHVLCKALSHGQKQDLVIREVLVLVLEDVLLKVPSQPSFNVRHIKARAPELLSRFDESLPQGSTASSGGERLRISHDLKPRGSGAVKDC